MCPVRPGRTGHTCTRHTRRHREGQARHIEEAAFAHNLDPNALALAVMARAREEQAYRKWRSMRWPSNSCTVLSRTCSGSRSARGAESAGTARREIDHSSREGSEQQEIIECMLDWTR